MHIWVTEFKETKDSKWEVYSMHISRNDARTDARHNNNWFYKTRVVKYISTKGE